MAYGDSRRLSGRALLGGFGVLGMVLTIGIMAMLAVRVLDSSPVDSGDAPSGVIEQLGDAVQPSDPGGSQATPTAGSEAARRSACATDRSTLELASAAYQTLNGTPPTDQAALIADGLLDAAVPTFRLVPSDGGVELVGAGNCLDA